MYSNGNSEIHNLIKHVVMNGHVFERDECQRVFSSKVNVPS